MSADERAQSLRDWVRGQGAGGLACDAVALLIAEDRERADALEARVAALEAKLSAVSARPVAPAPRTWADLGLHPRQARE